MKGAGFAKIKLNTLKAIQNYLKPKGLKIALEIVKKHKEEFERKWVNDLIKGKEVHFDENYIHVTLEDGKIISTPIEWYEPLKKASLEQLKL